MRHGSSLADDVEDGALGVEIQESELHVLEASVRHRIEQLNDDQRSIISHRIHLCIIIS